MAVARLSIASEVRLLLRNGPLHGKAAEESSCQQHVIIIVVAIKYNELFQSRLHKPQNVAEQPCSRALHAHNRQKAG